jgi:hypothetical protein
MLSDMVIETETITFRSQSFKVRGLGLDVIAALLADGNRVEIEAAVDQLEAIYKTLGKDKGADMKPHLNKLVVQLPGLVAKAIAYAADEPQAVDVVRKLPVTVQLQAIMAIGRLTFDGETSVKNFMSDLMSLMTSAGKTADAAGKVVSIGTQS